MIAPQTAKGVAIPADGSFASEIDVGGFSTRPLFLRSQCGSRKGTCVPNCWPVAVLAVALPLARRREARKPVARRLLTRLRRTARVQETELPVEELVGVSTYDRHVLEPMLERIYASRRTAGPGESPQALPQEPAVEEGDHHEEGEASRAQSSTSVDESQIKRSGRVCVLGAPNAGKSSLVNALVGSKVSIVSAKAQTTRQRVMGLALLSPWPEEPPVAQAVFLDTAGITVNSLKPLEHGGVYIKRSKRWFGKPTPLHQAMTKTSWNTIDKGDVVFWVLDAERCAKYGDYMPEVAMLDGIEVGPTIRDAWWTHPEMDMEIHILRELKTRKQLVHVILNKMDKLEEVGVDVDAFTSMMREVLTKDLAVGRGETQISLLGNLWPTSVLKDDDSLMPIKAWLCENLPERHRPLYPVQVSSDMPARVVASEITREKLFENLHQEIPYQITVLNTIWREGEDGSLVLGQKVVVVKENHKRILRTVFRQITPEVEAEISETVNQGRPVILHFAVVLDPDWENKAQYYDDLQSELDTDSSLEFHPMKRYVYDGAGSLDVRTLA
mmetsp:Transcript_27376/g.63895  ORF Transcript_27376/g.63895 Transcript_27376/m.63895 type:complete len:556 (+) Transcript_27376:50-1717(+)